MIAPIDMVPHIVDTFNSQHNRIKFTVEFEENHCLNFLDTSIVLSTKITSSLLIGTTRKHFQIDFQIESSYLS